MKALSQTTQFARDVKRMRKWGKDLAKLETIVTLLALGEVLASKYRDHPLKGEWRRSRDCHIEPDWILIYTTDEMSLRLERMGTHADLFE
jgi:mRNA interferase YafQ